MINRDFHGWLVEDALTEIDRIIGDVRLHQHADHAKFITGRGVIRQEILDTLTEYGLHPELQWGNDGVIIVTIL